MLEVKKQPVVVYMDCESKCFPIANFLAFNNIKIHLFLLIALYKACMCAVFTRALITSSNIDACKDPSQLAQKSAEMAKSVSLAKDGKHPFLLPCDLKSFDLGKVARIARFIL